MVISFTYDKTWWFECCLDDDNEIIYGDVELVEKASFPVIRVFTGLPPLLFKDDIIFTLVSLLKLQLHTSSSFSWVWLESVVTSFVFPLSSSWWCNTDVTSFEFASFMLIGTLVWPTTARSHLTALVFLGDDRVATLARGPLEGDDGLLLPDVDVELADGCTNVLLVEGRWIGCWFWVSINYMSDEFYVI